VLLRAVVATYSRLRGWGVGRVRGAHQGQKEFAGLFVGIEVKFVESGFEELVGVLLENSISYGGLGFCCGISAVAETISKCCYRSPTAC
jgi:hypothetical protein